MKSYIDTLLANSTSNSTDDNVTEILNSTSSSETGNQEAADTLFTMWVASVLILACSMLRPLRLDPFTLMISSLTLNLPSLKNYPN